MLAVSPRHPLDRHAAAPAIDTPHAVEKEHRNGPLRDELESALVQGGVLGTPVAAVAARQSAAAVGLDFNQDSATAIGEKGGLVNEALLLFDTIEDSLKLNLVRREA